MGTELNESKETVEKKLPSISELKKTLEEGTNSPPGSDGQIVYVSSYHTPLTYGLFKRFCVSEFSQENTKFLDEWQKLIENSEKQEKFDYAAELKALYGKYIPRNATEGELNLPSKQAAELKVALDKEPLDVGDTLNLFSSAASAVLGLVKNDSLKRFPKSTLYNIDDLEIQKEIQKEQAFMKNKVENQKKEQEEIQKKEEAILENKQKMQKAVEMKVKSKDLEQLTGDKKSARETLGLNNEQKPGSIKAPNKASKLMGFDDTNTIKPRSVSWPLRIKSIAAPLSRFATLVKEAVFPSKAEGSSNTTPTSSPKANVLTERLTSATQATERLQVTAPNKPSKPLTILRVKEMTKEEAEKPQTTRPRSTKVTPDKPSKPLAALRVKEMTKEEAEKPQTTRPRSTRP
ncbi:MAG TPA: regulator of G-protein signaling domain-containing protein [Gammaproteobacteria bacterium]|nr:regulator of G-protein signaling domain-containing protein [Gammaproteobacteria bacterium]